MNPNAIHILEKNPENIVWENLSVNPNALHLLEKNQEKICWIYLSSNPSIFKRTINCKLFHERMNIIREELIMKCMHPRRLERWIELCGDIDDF
jgi:Leu/Phe-tRNA-protein transferase